MFNVNLDKAVEEIVGLGVPGLIFVALIATSGLSGAAAITFALSAFGPGGMIGGLISFPVAYLITKAVSKYGVGKVLETALKQMKKDGYSKEEIIDKIEGYKISEDLKAKLINAVKDFYEGGSVSFEG